MQARLACLFFLGCVSPALTRTDVPAETHSAPTQVVEAQDLGCIYTAWLYGGDLERLWERFSPQAREVFGGLNGLYSFREKVRAQLGVEARVVNERTLPWLAYNIYHRMARFSESSNAVWVQWMLDPAGEILGLQVQPAQRPAASRFLDYRTQTPLQLPFFGQWSVFWGGRTAFENYHAVAPDQRFAYDFVIARNRSTHHGGPARNDHHFCFGKPVLAPASAIVIAAEQRVPDNVPGKMNEEQPLGNHVILDHGNGEYSFLAHLKQGSVSVEPGQPVQTGVMLGRCGNSGRSSEPHLHYHLQTMPAFGQGEGLPAQFRHYRANGEAMRRGEPTRGQRVAPAEGKRSRN